MWMLDQNPNPHTVFAHMAVSPLTHFTVLGWRHEVSPIAYSLLLVADNFSESYCSPPPLYPIQIHNWLLPTGWASTALPGAPKWGLPFAGENHLPPGSIPRSGVLQITLTAHRPPAGSQTPSCSWSATQIPRGKGLHKFHVSLGCPSLTQRPPVSKGWGMKQRAHTAQKLWR